MAGKIEAAEKPDWYFYERQARGQGFGLVCGIDEAGRGPLFGPVYAAAVILPPGCVIDGINDSKKLSEKKRSQLFDVITEKAAAFGIGSASAEEIDSINILQATFLAMRRAFEQLSPRPDFVLVDGNRLPKLPVPALAVIKGDSKSASIAAASILAKVSRDRLLCKLDEEYPEYGFARHKGYGTAAHYEAISRFGLLPEHRRSFLKNLRQDGTEK